MTRLYMTEKRCVFDLSRVSLVQRCLPKTIALRVLVVGAPWMSVI